MKYRSAIVYRFRNGLYLNITNRCPNHCIFCIKTKWAMDFRGYNLYLGGKEPRAETVSKSIQKEWQKSKFDEIVFCGYGEPTMRLKTLLGITKAVKSGKLGKDLSKIKVRLNTIGLGNLVNGRDITDDLKKAIDEVTISLNTVDEKQWLEIVRPDEKYRRNGFEGVKEFISLCAKKIKKTTVTAVDMEGVDILQVKRYCKEIGVNFRLRPYL